MWYLFKSGEHLMIPSWWGLRVAFDLTLKTTVLCMSPTGRLGVSPCDLFPFLIGQAGTPVVSEVALVTGGISEVGNVTPPAGSFTEREGENVVECVKTSRIV